MPLQGSLSVEQMYELVGVSQASLDRSLREQRPVEEEMEVRSAIQLIALDIAAVTAIEGFLQSCADEALGQSNY